MIWGRARKKSEKINSEAHLREKIYRKRPSPGKIILKRHFRGKNKSIFDSSSAPQIINGQPLTLISRKGDHVICPSD